MQLELASGVSASILSGFITENAITAVEMLYPELNETSISTLITTQSRRSSRQAKGVTDHSIIIGMSLNPASYTRVNEITKELTEAGPALQDMKQAIVSSIIAAAAPLQRQENGIVLEFSSPTPSQVSILLSAYNPGLRTTSAADKPNQTTTAPEQDAVNKTSGSNNGFWTDKTIQIGAISSAAVLVLMLICATFVRCGPAAQGYDTDETGSQFDSSYQFAVPGMHDVNNSVDSGHNGYGNEPSFVFNAGYNKDANQGVQQDGPELNSWV